MRKWQFKISDFMIIILINAIILYASMYYPCIDVRTSVGLSFAIGIVSFVAGVVLTRLSCLWKWFAGRYSVETGLRRDFGKTLDCCAMNAAFFAVVMGACPMLYETFVPGKVVGTASIGGLMGCAFGVLLRTRKDKKI